MRAKLKILVIFVLVMACTGASTVSSAQYRGLKPETASFFAAAGSFDVDETIEDESYDYNEYNESNGYSEYNKPDNTSGGYINEKMIIKNAGTDTNQKLYSVVGKSQILKFDQSIKRVSIASPDIVDIVVLSPQQLLINGKKPGTTSLVFWSNLDSPSFYNLVVQQDTDAFIQAVSYITPDEDVSILFNDTGAVLSGQVSSAATKEKIKDLAKAYNVNLLDLSESPAKQVLLEVKVVEASKDFSRIITSNIIGSNLDGVFPNPDNVFTGVLPTIVEGGQRLLELKNGAKLLFTSSDGKLAAQFTASDKKGNVKILAEPKLLTADGQQASFNVGNEIPVPSSIGQYGQVSYSFKKTGVLLNFTPHIMEQSDRIRLQLAPEISEMDRSAGIITGADQLAVPGFKTRKVDTTVELQSGETLVIAGLLSNNTSNNRTQVPFLGDIPILGYLFKNTENTKTDIELMIFITPHIVDSKTPIQSI